MTVATPLTLQHSMRLNYPMPQMLDVPTTTGTEHMLQQLRQEMELVLQRTQQSFLFAHSIRVATELAQ
jgi:hypothetical protein